MLVYQKILSKIFFFQKFTKQVLIKIDNILCQSSDDHKDLFALAQIMFKLQEVLN